MPECPFGPGALRCRISRRNGASVLGRMGAARRRVRLPAVVAAVLGLLVGGPAAPGRAAERAAPPPGLPVAASSSGRASLVPPRVVTQTPVRLVDDRSVPAGRVRCVQVAGRAGVAPEATSVFVNVTAVRPDGPGYVVVYPDTRGNGATPAPQTSTVNFEPGADVANAAVVSLPEDGKLCYLTRGAAHAGVLIDVTGFARGASGVHGESPRRLLDTRSGAGHVGPITGPVLPGREYTVDVLGHAGVPIAAAAVFANVTVTGVAAAGNLVVYPTDEGRPGTSTLNYAVGKDKANATVVGLSVGGKLSLYSTSSEPVQVVIDITGWIGADAPMIPVYPTRLMDTRWYPAGGPLARLHAAERRTLPVLAAAGGRVPQDAAGVLLNVTAVHPSAAGNLRVYPGDANAAVPYASSLNYVVGRDIPNLVVAALNQDGAITFYDDQAAGGTVDLVVDVVGYVAARTDVAVRLDPTVTPQTCDHGLLVGGAIGWPTPLPAGIDSVLLEGPTEGVEPGRDLDPGAYTLDIKVAAGYGLVDPGAADGGLDRYFIPIDVPAYGSACVPTTRRITDSSAYSATLSDGGRWVAFDSSASDVVPGGDPDIYWADAFVTDRLTGATEQISNAVPGQPDEYVGFRQPSISADGRYVAFVADTADWARCQVYLRDRQTGATTMVSTSPDGSPGSSRSNEPVLSADGRWVVYHTGSTNLVPGAGGGLYAYDRVTGETSFVAQGWSPAVSADGRWIAFLAHATSVLPDAATQHNQVFVRDQLTGATTLITADVHGAPVASDADHPAISGDGRWVAFDSDSPDIPDAPDPLFGRGIRQVYLTDRTTGDTTRVTRGRTQFGIHPGSSWEPSVSGDGRWVAFTTYASDLFGRDANDGADVAVWDRLSRRSVPLDVAADGMTADGTSGSPSISPDGHWIAYRSDAPSLGATGTAGSAGIFVTANPWARDQEPPGPATDVTVTGATTSSITLGWTLPQDPDLVGVSVRRAVGGTSPGRTGGVLVTDQAGDAVSDSGLEAGTTYSYSLIVRDVRGQDSTVTSVTVETLAP